MECSVGGGYICGIRVLVPVRILFIISNRVLDTVQMLNTSMNFQVDIYKVNVACNI